MVSGVSQEPEVAGQGAEKKKRLTFHVGLRELLNFVENIPCHGRTDRVAEEVLRELLIGGQLVVWEAHCMPILVDVQHAALVAVDQSVTVPSRDGAEWRVKAASAALGAEVCHKEPA